MNPASIARIGRSCALVAALAIVVALPDTARAQDEVLQPGDTLTLVIPDRTGNEPRTVVIDENGEISLGVYGRIAIAGMGATAARTAIRRQLSELLRSTTGVRLTVEQRGVLVYVTGQVATPGLLVVPRSADVWTAIQQAGGLLDGADIGHVAVLRGEEAEVLVDVRAFLTRQSTEPLPRLQPGDTVFVPAEPGLTVSHSAAGAFLGDEALASKVFVLGAVREPGLYDRSPGLDPLTALGLAGGPEESADLSGARLLTPTGSHRVDLARALLGDPGPHSLPEDGAAILYVPFEDEGEVNPFSDGIAIMGNLNTPRFLETQESIPLFEALALAGGPTETADIRRLYHVHEADGYTVASRYNLRRYFRHGGGLGSVTVSPGDVLYMRPDRGNPWEQFVSAFSDVAVISSAVLLFVTLEGRL